MLLTILQNLVISLRMLIRNTQQSHDHASFSSVYSLEIRKTHKNKMLYKQQVTLTNGQLTNDILKIMTTKIHLVVDVLLLATLQTNAKKTRGKTR